MKRFITVLLAMFFVSVVCFAENKIYYQETLSLDQAVDLEYADVFLVGNSDSTQYCAFVKVYNTSGNMSYCLYKESDSLASLYPYVPSLRKWISAANEDFTVVGVVNYLFKTIPEYVEVRSNSETSLCYYFPADVTFENAVYKVVD